MLLEVERYDRQMVAEMDLEKISIEEITSSLNGYLRKYDSALTNKSQQKYFRTFVKGLLSDLDRKTIEPIALTFLEECEVRGFQHFFKRTPLKTGEIQRQYQQNLGEAISEVGGMLCVDGSDFPKKGKNSVGVYRQHCGRMGKVENCQAGVFTSYVSIKGYGLVEGQLYLPKIWFSEDYAQRYEKSQVPMDVTFKTKNKIASEMIKSAYNSGLLEIEWLGCDAAFGCDHQFLASLPEGIKYFASVRETELVFRSMPDMVVPTNMGNGRRYKYPKPSISPIKVKDILLDPEISWENSFLTQGTKGPVYASTKCVRCISCSAQNEHGNYPIPGSEIWVYIRKYEDGTIKYFISNAPLDTPREVLNRIATMRWSIEQCFNECKSYLGMTHYETRTYQSWHRHMLMVMIAHLFTIVLRQQLKKTLFFHADDKISFDIRP